MAKDKLRIVPLGGLGEIGMNCMVLEWEEQAILIDCGIQFPDSSYAGVELLAPDLNYLRRLFPKLKGIAITHGHDDHIGALPYLARETPLSIYCTPFPKGLIVQKLTEIEKTKEVKFHEIKPREVFSIGPFKIDPIPVQHSIIESVAFAIQTPVGNIIHSGDFKHDANELSAGVIGFEPFEEWAKKGILLLLSDSTNAERIGHTLSEVDIAQSFEAIFSRQSGRLIVALFASNIRRVERLLWLAKKLGKKVALAGRSMHAYTKLAHEQSSLNIPEGTLVLLEDIQKYPDKEVIVLATGSQAEPQSALLRIAQGAHKDVHIKSGDVVIMSSRFIPGNERSITSMIDHLYRAGADVLYESIHQIHVSGHGFQDELLLMLNSCKPKFFVPIHGEYRHLKKHALLAKQAGVSPENVLVVEDGQVLEVSEDKIELGEKLALQKTALVDNCLIQGSATAFTQRTNLSKTGIVFTVAVRHSKTKKLECPSRVALYGLLFREGEDPGAILGEAGQVVDALLVESGERSDLEELIRVELRRFFKKRVSHKPVVIPIILDV